MKLSHLDKFTQIVIQIHDNPDADAIGSGYAIYKFFLQKGKNVRLIYGGENEMSKSNVKLLVSELDIPIEYVRELEPPELLLTVDCCYGQGNVQHFDAQNVAVIDHHNTGKRSDDMAEIRSNLVSCATVCYALLSAEGYDVNKDRSVATALYYGLYMDSNQLSEISHPLDSDMIDFLKYNKSLITRLKNANFSLSDLVIAGKAVAFNNQFLDKYRTGIISSPPCDPNILGLIGDLVIQVDTIDVCVIYSENQSGYKLSVRSSTLEVAANELAIFLTSDIGNGGGHLGKAGGFISKVGFNETYPDITLVEYFCKKIAEYYEGYDAVYYDNMPYDWSEFKTYRKKDSLFGYVKTSEMFKSGTECVIRTLGGDMVITANDDTYIIIASSGEAYPVEKALFEKKYQPLQGSYSGDFEYTPTVINIEENRSYSLLHYAVTCKPLSSPIVLARPADKYTKIFTKWDEDSYMTAKQGDMLCCPVEDKQDIYVINNEIFKESYALI